MNEQDAKKVKKLAKFWLLTDLVDHVEQLELEQYEYIADTTKQLRDAKDDESERRKYQRILVKQKNQLEGFREIWEQLKNRIEELRNE